MENNDIEYNLLVLGEINYKNAHVGVEEELLFPPEWDLYSDCNVKNEILEEAVMNNLLISETEGYQKYFNNDHKSLN